MSDPAVNFLFRVVVDVNEHGHTDLGAFTGCHGLSARYEVETYREGGENGFVHHLPGRVSYGEITLTRPLDATSTVVAAWFSRFRSEVRRTSARISAFGPDGRELASWTVAEVFPRQWTGPRFSAADGTTVASEVLVLVHNGFVLATPQPAGGAQAEVRV